MTEVIKTTFQLRRGSAEVWEKNNPVLAYGEPGFDKDNYGLKVGDGSTPWNELNFLGVSKEDIKKIVEEYFEENPGTGTEGTPGKDGVSATHEWNGTVLTITSASGTSSADLVGPEGPQGPAGQDGENGQNGSKGDKGDTGEQGPAGRGIVSVLRTSGTGAPGTTDIYTITYTDDTTSIFTVYNGANGADGENGIGADGFSPIATVTEINDGAIITIIDKSGTTTTTIKNGKDGEDGAQGEKGEKGDKGEDGTGVTILGSFSTEEELKQTHPTGEVGQSYLVAGSLYVWSATENDWANVGNIQGPKGDKGDPGETGAVGPIGPTGKDGAPGKTAYEYAKDAGYTKTESDFASKLAEENYTKEEVDNLIASSIATADHLQRIVIDNSLNIDVNAEGAENFIYMVPKSEELSEDHYDEFMVINGKIEKVGDWAIDLTDYAQKDEIPSKTSELINDSNFIDETKISEAINDALAQAKESGEFDGADGQDGSPGADGITPHVGSNGNWFIGDNDTGIPATGPAGDQGLPGTPGEDGKDGTSATHSWNGTVLSVTSASGTSSANLKGSKGDKGDKGDPFTYEDFTEEQIRALTGPRGPKGDPGTTDHSQLSNRDAADQHPIEAITGLREILDKVTNGSCGNAGYVLPVGGEELGGVKNGGNVVINADGTMTAPEGGNSGGTNDYTELTNKPKINGVELAGEKSLEELGIGQPTDEQVGTAVKEYLDEHPEATTTVADKSITPAKTDFLEVVSAEALTLTLTADGYLTYRTDYIDVSGGRSLYVTVTGLINSNPRDIYLEGSGSNKSAVLSETRLDDKEISRIKYESDGTRTLMYSIDVPKYGEFSYVRLWIGKIMNTDTAYTVRAYYSKEAASAVADFVRPSHKYDVRLADGSISLKQTDFASYVNPTIMDYTNEQTTGYNTDEHLNQFGAAYVLYFADYLEVNENHELYIRSANSNYSTNFIRKVVCYDADKNTLPDETYTDIVVRNASGNSLDGSKITLDDGREAPVVSTHKITVSENVKYIRWSGECIDGPMYDFIIVSQEDIVNLTAVPEKYALSVSDDFKEVVQTCVKGNKEYSGVFIGDSLTNWGGGGVGSGFLGIVHEKTGMSPTNEGLAGAWWQTGGGQTACAVQRVDKIIADGRKYDLYCFLMGTNAGANTDTGETSADPSTMPGAIRYCMEKLKSYDPTAQILVCLPPQRAEGNENQEKVNEVIKKIVESYSVKTLDVYHHSGIVPNTVVANANYLPDGLHLGENGITVLGNMLASEIKYLFCL